MENSIEKLNQTLDEREKMIDSIIYRKHEVVSDSQYDKLYKMYNKKSYKDLYKEKENDGNTVA